MNAFLSRVRPGLLLVLALGSFCMYMSVYSGRIESGDTIQIIDAASSLARYGDLGYDEALWVQPPVVFADATYPLVIYEQNEPALVWLTALFYRVADALPQVGFVHMMYLVNVVVSTLIVIIVFGYVRVLGYSLRITLITALVCGFATIIWPYSKTLFRELLVTLFLLSTALSLQVLRQREFRRSWWLGIVGVLFYGAAYLTKNSAVFALPALALLVLPLPSQGRWRWVLNGLLSLAILALIGFVFWSPVFDLVETFAPLLPRRVDVELAQVALHTYLFSIGGSFWGTSPVLLLALVGVILLLRQQQDRFVWTIFALIFGYAIGHAFFTDVHWFGGLSWPPRFLVPIVPFVCLLLPPIFDWLSQESRLVWRWLAGVLVVYSVVIQIIAVVSRFDAYNALLPLEANQLSEWSDGLNTIEYLRWIILPQSWATIGFDIAWARSDVVVFALIFAVLGMLLLRLCWHWIDQPPKRWVYGLSGVAIGVITFIGLQQLYARDPEYWAYKTQLFDMLAILETEAEDQQPVILADRTYDEFILNYNDLDSVRPIGLGFQPGEAISEQEPPRVVGDYPPALLESYVPRLLDHLARRHERFWLLAHNSPFVAWSVRPVEQFLSQNYYVLQDITIDDPTVRLLEYSTQRAPSRYNFRLPEHTTDLRYGDHIHLSGFTLPAGITYQAGDVVPISLFWQTDSLLETDYVVAWFVVGKEGLILPIQGIDTLPDSGFSPTTTWQPQVPIWDNHALVLPDNVPQGEYEVWILLYPVGSGGVERLPVTGSFVLEGTIGVLPITLQIVAQNS